MLNRNHICLKKRKSEETLVLSLWVHHYCLEQDHCLCLKISFCILVSLRIFKSFTKLQTFYESNGGEVLNPSKQETLNRLLGYKKLFVCSRNKKRNEEVRENFAGLTGSSRDKVGAAIHSCVWLVSASEESKGLTDFNYRPIPGESRQLCVPL